MVALLAFLVAGVLATGRSGRAGDAPPAVTQEATVQETTVKGTVPDLTGRWLALARLRIPGDRVRASPALWEIGRREGRLEVTVRFAGLPPRVQEAIDRSDGANQAWTPTPEDMALLADGWNTLPPREPDVARVETSIVGHDALDEAYTREPKTKDASWVVTQRTTFATRAAPAVSQVQVYATHEATSGGYGGTFVSTTLAAAPFPIPITFEGTFDLYRIEARVRGPWQRLLDALAGCGRR